MLMDIREDFGRFNHDDQTSESSISKSDYDRNITKDDYDAKFSLSQLFFIIIVIFPRKSLSLSLFRFIINNILFS